MKIRINEYGSLGIDNKDKYCPFANSEEDNRCGDWCALFSTELVPADEFYRSSDEIYVDLCHHRYVCDPKDFTDERAKS